MARFSIEEFKAHVARRGGLAKPNRFFVSLTPPLGMRAGLSTIDVGNSIEYQCEGINFPGFQLNTQDYRRYQYGPSEKRPFGPHVNPLQMTIIADAQGVVWKFFQEWMSFIMPHSMEFGIRGVPTNDIGNQYQIAYRRDYITDVSIYHLPEHYSDGSQYTDFTNRIICYDCFPTAITDIALNWADNNNLVRFGVQMDYLDFHWRPDSPQGG